MTEAANFGRVAQDYAKYRDELPSVIFDQLRDRGIDFKDRRVIDLGAGTGIFSRALARQGAIVIGVEPESDLIEQAVAQDENVGLKIDYIHSSAEGYEVDAASVDIITALRAWHWFDREQVNRQVLKHLGKDGYLIVIHAIFVPNLSRIAQDTIEVVKASIPLLKPAGSMAEVKERRNGLPVNWFDEWEVSGLHVIDEWQYDYELLFTRDDWCGKVRSLSWLTDQSEEVKASIISSLIERLSEYDQPFPIPHRYSVVLLKKGS